MAITNVMVLERAQAVTEATRGTLVGTNTRWLYPIQGGITWTHDIPTDDTKEALRTYYATDNQTMGIPTTRLNIETVVSYDELPWWMTFILEGATLTGAAVNEGYAYEFDPLGATDDLKSFSLVAGDGTLNYEFKRCMVNRATFRFNPQSGGDAHWHLTMEVWGIFNSATGTFDSVSDIAREKVLSKGTTVYSDAAGGTIGSTATSALIRSGSITIDNQLEEKIFMESTAAHTDVGRGEQIITAELVAEFANDTYFGYFRAGTRRMFRIQQTGTDLGTDLVTARFDMPYAHIVSFSPSHTGQNITATIGLVAETNRGGSVVTPLECYVINELATVTA